MDLLAHFSALLDAQAPDLARSEQIWDRRAAEVSRFTVDVQDMALRNVRQHLELNGKRVLEVSFGGGRHLLEFARLGAHISGVEISAKMLAYCRQKLLESGLPHEPQQLVQSSWEMLDLDAHNWRQAFDLVFLYMSPAISSTAMLQKLLDASRSGLYVVLYSHREDSLLGMLQDALLLPRKAVGTKGAHDIYNIFNTLYQWGHFPELSFEERSKTSHFYICHILERYASWLWRGEEGPGDREKLHALLEGKSRDGKVATTSRDIIGHLYLDKRLRR